MAETSTQAFTEKLLRRTDVEQITAMKRSSIYAKMDANSPHHDSTFPRPVRLGKRAVAWKASEIAAWVNSRVSAA